VEPGRQHKREPLDDDGFRLVCATARIKVVSRQVPTSSLTGPLHFYPCSSDLSSGKREKDEDEIVGTGPTNVPSAIVVAPTVSEHNVTGRDLGEKGKGNGRRNGPCYRFLDGKCQRGNGCKFFHPVEKGNITKLKLDEDFVVWRSVGARRGQKSIGGSSVAGGAWS
jgi:hypothetical protein